MSVNTYKLFCISEALSPITHMMGTSGNESLINREPIFTKNGVVSVPVLSGNALRHRAIRESGVKYLIGLYNLAGKLNLDQMNFMLSGGSLTESSVTDNMNTIADLQKLFPLFRLLGGSLRNQIISGSLNMGRGLLICEENRDTINNMLPDGFDKMTNPLLRAEVFVGNYQYTRGDAKRMKDVDFFLTAEELNNPPEKSNLMIYNGQTVIRNSIFAHEIIALNISDMELGALLDALTRWQAKGGTIGGQSRIGHGKLKTSIYIDGVDNHNDLIRNYQEYAKSVKDDATQWLNDNFSAKIREPKKAKEKKDGLL